MERFRAVAAIATILFGLTGPLAAQQSGGTKVGALTCKTSASLGLVIGSHQKLACSFSPSDGTAPDYYTGHVTRLGLDLGFKAAGVMVWGVFAPTNGIHHGALAGSYVGGSGDIALGLGVGAKALFGGSHRSIALQPLSVEGQVGVNLALGVAGLRLNAAR